MEERRNSWIYNLVNGWIDVGNEKDREDKNWYLLVFPAFAVVTFVSMLLFKWCASHKIHGIPVLLLSLSGLPLTCAITLLLAKWIAPLRSLRERLRWTGWNKGNVLAALNLFFVVLPSILLLNLSSVQIFKLFNWKITEPELPMLLRNCSWTVIWIIAFGAVVVAPFVEEILFRRILFSFIASRVNTLAGVVITAALFALIHGCPVQFPALFMLGVMLQLLFISRRSLAAPIMLHMFNNAFAISLMILGRLCGWDWLFEL